MVGLGKTNGTATAVIFSSGMAEMYEHTQQCTRMIVDSKPCSSIPSCPTPSTLLYTEGVACSPCSAKYRPQIHQKSSCTDPSDEKYANGPQQIFSPHVERTDKTLAELQDPTADAMWHKNAGIVDPTLLHARSLSLLQMAASPGSLSGECNHAMSRTKPLGLSLRKVCGSRSYLLRVFGWAQTFLVVKTSCERARFRDELAGSGLSARPEAVTRWCCSSCHRV
jgi:hypothetical protein